MSDRNVLWTYRAEIARRAPLTAEAEVELALRCRGGDREAARRLIEGCLTTVLAIAATYRRWGAPLEDLVQEGNVGLLKAVDRFDPAFGVRLSSYAAYWIRASIREHVARYYRIVRLGSTKAERRALRIFRRTREHRPEQLAVMSGLPESRAAELLPMLLQRDASLSPGEPDEGPGLLDRLADRSTTTPEDAICDADERRRRSAAVSAAIARLAPRDQDIVRRRLLAETPVTLAQIGATWGVSKERVRQLEVGAKLRLRDLLADVGAPPR